MKRLNRNNNNNVKSKQAKRRKTHTQQQVTALPKPTDLVRHELSEYEAACEIIKNTLLPDRTGKGCPRITGTEPTTEFQPVASVDIKFIGVGGAGYISGAERFSIMMKPSLWEPLWITDMTKSVDSYMSANRVFSLRQSRVRLEDLSPPGRLEHDTPIQCSQVPTTMQFDFFTNRGDTMLPGFYNTTLQLWMNPINYLDDGSVEPTVTIIINAYRLQTHAGYINLYDENLNLIRGSPLARTTVGTEETLSGNILAAGATATRARYFALTFGAPPAGPNEVKDIHASIDWKNAMSPTPDVMHRYDFPNDIADDVEDIAERYEVLGQTMTLSYQGSDLVNGGTIYGHRLPKGYVPQVGVKDYINMIGGIPKFFNGPLKTGAWTYNLPTVSEDYEPVPIHSNASGAWNLISGVVDEDNVRLTLTFAQKIRASTTSTLFKPKFPNARYEAYENALNYMQRLPTVTCNPDHIAKINKVLKFLADHKQQIRKGAHTAASIAKILAPLLGTVML
jgi:hypothetical protein